MKSKVAAHKYHLLILIIAIFWLGISRLLLQVDSQSAVFPDAESYRDAAVLLYRDFTFHWYRPVLMPAIMGLPYVFGYTDPAIVQFGFYVNLACWLGTIFLLYNFLRGFLTDQKAFFCTICYILIIGSTLLIFHLLTESLYTFCMMLGFYFLIRLHKPRHFRNLAIALGIFILSILIKPGSQFFVIIICIWHIPIVLENYKHPALLFVAGSLLLIGVQVFQMKKAYGDYTISYISGVTYYNYLGAKAAALKKGVGFGVEKRRREAYIFTLPVSAQNEIAAADLKNQIRYNTLNLMQAYVSNVAENMTTPSDCIAICQNTDADWRFEIIKKIYKQISKWQNRILSALGVFLSILSLLRFKHSNPFYLLISVYILSVIFLSGLSCYQGDRFHVVCYPFAILLAGKFYAGIKTRSHEIKKPLQRNGFKYSRFKSYSK